MNVVLEIKNLNVYYGSIHAIKGISFHVSEGEIVSLIGANGAGKTSTLRAISGIVQSKGEVFLQGQSIANIPIHEKIKLGMSQSPEGRGVFPNLSVLENLEIGGYSLKNKSDLEEGFEKAFHLFPRLKERKSQLAGTLSGGEQQMLAISRALMTKPKVLLLDEPSLGLAPMIVSQIFSIIEQLNQEKVTVLLVEQNARMALKASHRAYVIETGLITLSGTGTDLLGNDQVRQSYLGG